VELSTGTGQGTDVVITPDQQVLATISSLTLSSPDFAGLTPLTVTNLQITKSGFTLGNLELSSSDVTIGSAFHFDSATVDLNNFALQYGATPKVNGSITFNVTGAELFPDIPLLDIHLGLLSGGFDFGDSGSMHITINDLDIPLGDAATIHMGD